MFKKEFLLVVILPLLTQCAHLSGKSIAGHNSAAKKSSRTISSIDQNKIDSVHVKTQANFHFLKGELLSQRHPEEAIQSFKEALIYDQKSADLRLRIAGEYIRAGLVSEAMDQAEEAKKLDNKNNDVRLVLAGLYTSTKMHDKALAEYNYLAAQDFHNDDVLTYRGVLLAEMGRAQESVQEFKKLAKTSADPAKAYYYMGRIYLEFFDNAEKQTIAAFKKSVNLNPSYILAVTDLARIYRAKNNTPMALKLLESHYETYGAQLQTSKMLSQIYLTNNKFAKAIEHLEVIERRAPDDQNNILKLALSLIENKDYTSAIIKLEGLLANNPGNEKLLFYLGSVNEEINKPLIAEGYFKEIKSSSSLYSQAVTHRAYILKDLSGINSSLALLDTVISENTENEKMYLLKASFLDEQGRTSEALESIAVAKSKFGDSINIAYYQGALLDKSGNKKLAIEAFKSVLKKQENHTQSLNHLAYVYAELGVNLKQAERLAFLALKQRPKDGHILDTIGYIYLKQGKLVSALRHLELAEELLPKESIIAEHLADVYYKQRRHSQAKKLYKKAVELANDKKTISTLEAKIKIIESLRLPATVARP